MNKHLQYSAFRRYDEGQNFENEEIVTQLPSRVPSLLEIAKQFTTGQPIDASLNRNLGYNPIEGNPMLAKGVDLADLPQITKAVGQTMEQALAEIDRAKAAQSIQKEGKISNPTETAPDRVSTE